MPFKWDNYVDLAERIGKTPTLSGSVSTEPEERQANFRAGISRAYYGLFKTVHDYIRDGENDANLLVMQKKRRR